jgi:hypothetical protein
MKILPISLVLSGIFRRRMFLIRSTILAILSVGLAQTAADGIAEGQRDNGRRTLHVMEYGYALPIEITTIRNFHSSHWLRDLEIELKNVSSKPIYEIYLMLFLPDDMPSPGTSYGVSLQYGRLGLIHPRQRPLAEDKPIWPGESILLRVDERLGRGYEKHIKRQNVPAASSYNTRMAILAINFGDGTGFINGGVPYPRKIDGPKPSFRYVRIPIESNEQSLAFRIIARASIGSESPSDSVAASFHALDFCCPNHCDGNYSNTAQGNYCSGCWFSGCKS